MAASNSTPSIAQISVWPCAPSASRGVTIRLSADPTAKYFCYASRKSVIVREFDNPENAKVYTGHKHNATAASFSPSGTFIASGDSRGIVQIWYPNQEGMNMKYEYQLLTDSVRDIGWDSESKRLLVVGEGRQKFGTAILVETGSTTGSITGHSKNINCLAVRSTRPFRAATGSDDMKLCFHSGFPVKNTSVVRGEHSTFLLSAAFSPTGNQLVSGALDGKLVFYNGDDGEKMRDIPAAHAGGIYAISWSPDGKKFITSSSDSTVKLWDVETQVAVATWSGENVWGSSVAAAKGIGAQQLGNLWPRDDLLVSASLDGTIWYLDERSVGISRKIGGHMWSHTCAKQVCDGKALVTADGGGRVCVWDIESGRGGVVENLPAETGVFAIVEEIKDSSEKKDVPAAAHDATTKLACVSFSSTLFKIEVAQKDASVLSGGNADDRTKAKYGGTFKGSVAFAGTPRSLAVHSRAAGETEICLGTAEGIMAGPMNFKNDQASSGVARELYRQDEKNKKAVGGQFVAIDSKNKVAAVGSGSSNIVRLYEADEFIQEESVAGNEIQNIQIGPVGITPLSLMFSPCGKLLVVVRSDACLKVYNIQAARASEEKPYSKVAHEFNGHSGIVPAVTFSKSMKYIVTGGSDSQLILWSLERPRAREVVATAHKGGISSVIFDSNAEKEDVLISVGDDGCVRKWKISRFP